jgi:hypothetical protein
MAFRVRMELKTPFLHVSDNLQEGRSVIFGGVRELVTERL